MKATTILIAALAGLTAASPTYRSISVRSAEESSLNNCVECAKYCSDPANGSSLGAACYIVKCGIKACNILNLILKHRRLAAYRY